MASQAAAGMDSERLPTLLERRPLISRSEQNAGKTWNRADLPEEFRDLSPFGNTLNPAPQRVRCNWRPCAVLPYGVIVGVSVLAAVALLPGWPAPGCAGKPMETCDCPVKAYWCLEFSALLAGLAAALLLDQRAQVAQSHISSAAYYAVSNWIAGMSTVVAPNVGAPSCFAAGWASRETLVAVMFALRSIFWLLGQLWMQQLVLDRIRALEASSLRPLGGSLMAKCMCYQLASMALMCCFMPYVPHDCMKGRWFAHLYREPLKSLPSLVAACLIVSSTFFSFVVSGLAVKCLLAVVSVLQEAHETTCRCHLSTEVHLDIGHALATAKRQLGGVLASLMMSSFVWAAFAIWTASPTPGAEVLNIASQSFDTIVHAVAAIFLSGGHVAKTPSIVRKLSEGTGCCTMTSCLEPAQVQTDMGEMWNQRVIDLAHRSITLEVLLDFYGRLGKDLMPHFDPNLHSTHNVVRQAIIPISKSSRSDGASVLMHGSRRPPDSMVTHAWTNRFRDLVACIVAHVLQECSYQLVVKLLDKDTSTLRRMLQQAGQLQYACWICAFAVNQHSGICASPPSVADPVSGLMHPRCDCGLPKFFNSDGALALDGRSIQCEMNKFSDVMMLLASSNANLVQCIAVDEDFDVFSRAWCIAEAVEACRLKIKQVLVVPSRNRLLAQTPWLLNLRVEDMQASFQEDKELIMAKISDKPAFNRQLQKLIFDQQQGLLAVWHHLDAEQQMGEVGRILRWHGADGGTGTVWSHWEP